MRHPLPGLAVLAALAALATACTGDKYTVYAPREVEVGQTFRIQVYDACHRGNAFAPMGSGDLTCVKDEVDIKGVRIEPRDRLRVVRFVSNNSTQAAVELRALRPGEVRVSVRGHLGWGEHTDTVTLRVVDGK